MDNWITTYVRELTPSEVETIRRYVKTTDREEIEKAAKIVGADASQIHGIGDTMKSFETKPMMNGLYRMHKESRSVYYVVLELFGPDMAFCLSLY